MTGVRGPAATGLGKQVRAAQGRLVVPFEDNRHLNRLLGEYDGHLALLEERLGIEAQAHGNVVTLTGATGAVETAPATGLNGTLLLAGGALIVGGVGLAVALNSGNDKPASP